MSRWGGPIAIAEILLTSNNFQRYIAWKGGQVRRAVRLPDAVVPDRETGAAFVWVLQLSYRQGRTPQLQIGLLFQLREGPHRPVVRRDLLEVPYRHLVFTRCLGACWDNRRVLVSSRRRCGLDSAGRDPPHEGARASPGWRPGARPDRTPSGPTSNGTPISI